MNIHTLLQDQRANFASGATLPVSFRIAMLKRLYNAILAREEEICDALYEDLGKSRFEAYMCEVGMTLAEISYLIKHVRRFAADNCVHTPLAQFRAKSYTKASPYGCTLIMSPWNYPFLLTLEPLADAIAAGNTAIVKPSAYSPATSTVIERMLSDIYPADYVAAVTGGRKENAALLSETFDFVFFTGSQAVGKEVLRHTAETLTPVVLELGGKSPCIVDETAKVNLAARRIVFGKYLNCGQTCVAPDYILCQESVKPRLVAAIRREIVRQFGEHPLTNENYGKIISDKHFARLLGLLDKEKIVHGGENDPVARKIAPAVMDGVTWQDAVMQEEIFGPILPILTYSDFDDIYPLLAAKQKPLALYLFSENKKRIREATARLSFGGGCINDTIIHLATSEMPFGGVGESGMGGYHGKDGFLAFSHTKSIVDKKTWLDLPLRYQPYTSKLREKMLRLFLK